MSKVLKETLKMDLPALADLLRSKGRGKDTMLAHITPREAALLKRRGGSGTINPDTGLPEFEDSGSYDFSAPAPVSPTYDVVSTPSGGGAPTFTPTQADTGVPLQVGQSYTPGGESYAPSVSPTGNASYDVLNQYGQTTPYTYTPGATTFSQLQPSGPTVPTETPASNIPGTISPVQQAAAPVVAPDGTTKQSYGDKFLTALTDPNRLLGLGLATGLGAFGASQARKSAGQVQAAQGQEQAIATPYQQQGQTLINQAQAGQLSPASQQAFQAAQAQINQQVANRGGVGTQQAANQLAAIYQTLLNNQYTYGLNVMQIGDNISLGAIKTGLQLDTQLNQATTNFYSQLAQMVGGMPNAAQVKPAGTP